MKKIGVIIPAGGAGARMSSGGAGTGVGAGAPKQFMLLGGEPVLAWVIRAFHDVVRDAEIMVALPAAHIEEWARMCLEEHDVPPHKICEGGATRFESVRRALDELDPDCEYIAVHDAARPLVSSELIIRTLETARRHGTAIPVMPLVDSVRRLREAAGGELRDGAGGENGVRIESGSYPEDRASLRAVQTPQVFRADILCTGYERAVGEVFTDDATVVESVGYSVMLCEGERRNLKITEPIDLVIAEAILNNEH